MCVGEVFDGERIRVKGKGSFHADQSSECSVPVGKMSEGEVRIEHHHHHHHHHHVMYVFYFDEKIYRMHYLLPVRPSRSPRDPSDGLASTRVLGSGSRLPSSGRRRETVYKTAPFAVLPVPRPTGVETERNRVRVKGFGFGLRGSGSG